MSLHNPKHEISEGLINIISSNNGNKLKKSKALYKDVVPTQCEKESQFLASGVFHFDAPGSRSKFFKRGHK